MMAAHADDTEPAPDSVVRAITHDGAFRVIVARTTETVRGTLRSQGASGETARHFGELITGAVLVREAMAPQLRVQGILKGARGRGSLVADSYPDGTSRGLVNFGAKKAEIELSPGALLQVMRTLPNGMVQQGVVAVPEGAGVSGALMAYLQDSEQVVSTIGVAAVFEGSEVVSAGGYLVQLLPEVERGPLMIMTERLQETPLLDRMLASAAATAGMLLDELLFGMPYDRVGESALRFECGCSEARLLASLATLPRADIEQMVNEGGVLEIRCDYCAKDYAIRSEALRTVLTTN